MCDPATPLTGYIPGEREVPIHTQTSRRMLRAALVLTAKSYRPPHVQGETGEARSAQPKFRNTIIQQPKAPRPDTRGRSQTRYIERGKPGTKSTCCLVPFYENQWQVRLIHSDLKKKKANRIIGRGCERTSWVIEIPYVLWGDIYMYIFICQNSLSQTLKDLCISPSVNYISLQYCKHKKLSQRHTNDWYAYGKILNIISQGGTPNLTHNEKPLHAY